MDKKTPQLEQLRQAQERVSQIALQMQSKVAMARHSPKSLVAVASESMQRRSNKAKLEDSVWSDSCVY